LREEPASTRQNGNFPRKDRKGRNVGQSETRRESAMEILTRNLGLMLARYRESGSAANGQGATNRLPDRSRQMRFGEQRRFRFFLLSSAMIYTKAAGLR